MKRLNKISMIAACGFMLAMGTTHTATAQANGKVKQGEKTWVQEERGEWWQGKSRNYEGNGQIQSFKNLNVPPGHLPPPGECTVWLPNTPPGQQPAPQSCASATYQVPPGAWIITHQDGQYQVNMYHHNRTSVLDKVIYYTDK